MPYYHAYKPREDESRPVGTFDQMVMRDLKTDRGAIRRAKRRFGERATIVVECYPDKGAFFRQDHGKRIYPTDGVQS